MEKSNKNIMEKSIIIFFALLVVCSAQFIEVDSACPTNLASVSNFNSTRVCTGHQLFWFFSLKLHLRDIVL